MRSGAKLNARTGGDDARRSRSASAAGLAVVALPVAFLLYEFVGGSFSEWLLALCTPVAFIASFVIVERHVRVLAGAMLACSLAGLPWAGLEATREGALAGSGVISFIVAAQFLGDALFRGGYDRLIRALWTNLTWQASWVALLGTYLLSWAFMFTSMPVMYAAVYRYDDAARAARSPVAKDLGILLARAYGAAAVATPMGAMVLVALAVTGVSLGNFLLVATPLSLALAPLSLIGLHKRLRALDDPDIRLPTTRTSRALPYVLLTTMVLALTALIAAVSILHIPPLGGVSAGVILVAMVWGFLGTKIVPGAPGGYAGTRSELARYGHRLSSGALLMLAGSAAGTTLANTPVMDSIAGQLAQLDITILGVIITVVIVVVLRLVGMPPPAIVLVAGPALVRAVPLDPEAMAVLLVSACTLGILLSPSSLISAMVSALTGWSPVEVSLTRHLPYVTLAGILACAYVMLIS